MEDILKAEIHINEKNFWYGAGAKIQKRGCKGCDYKSELRFNNIIQKLCDFIIPYYQVNYINWKLQKEEILKEEILKAEMHFKGINITIELDYNDICFMLENKYIDYNDYIKHMISKRIDNKILENYKERTKTKYFK